MSNQNVGMDTLSELAAIYEDLEEAFLAQDLEAIAQRVHGEWQGFVGNQSISRDQMLRHVQAQFSKWEQIEWHRDISNLRVSGTESTVLATGEYRARERATGKPVSMHLANDDTWRKDDATGWKLVRSVSVDSETTTG